MKSLEENVSKTSNYFVYSPSRLAEETFLYPLQCGLFSYLPGYHLARHSFDSFLILYLEDGALEITTEEITATANAGDFVLLDCYLPHAYQTKSGAKCLWCHFDGVTASGYFHAITERIGNVLTLPNPSDAKKNLLAIYTAFEEGSILREPLLSQALTNLLTEFLLFEPNATKTDVPSASEATIRYIGEHFREDLSVETLAANAHLSLYHFIRTFKKETGFTPHEYLVKVRLSTAKYLLKNTDLSIKEICFSTGFSCESVFCSAFLKNQGLTPGKYRAGGSPKEKS